jgi:arylsulfatase A-like enzyme
VPSRACKTKTQPSPNCQAVGTIVVFTSDNGAETFSWPDGGNTPFRGEKGATREGGFRVPCLARWPGVIKPGSMVNDTMLHEDWLPTFLAAAGEPDIKAKLLRGLKGDDKTFKTHPDGYKLHALFQG